MNWIKFSDRMPWKGQKIILQCDYKALPKRVYRVDTLMYLAFKGGPLDTSQNIRWKPYTERKPIRKCDHYLIDYGSLFPNSFVPMINPIDVSSVELGPKYHRCNAIEPMDNSVVFCDEVEWR